MCKRLSPVFCLVSYKRGTGQPDNPRHPRRPLAHAATCGVAFEAQRDAPNAERLQGSHVPMIGWDIPWVKTSEIGPLLSRLFSRK